MLKNNAMPENIGIIPGRIGVIGLGLIGGSLAKALKRRAKLEVIGLDREWSVVKSAISEGVLSAGAVLPRLPSDLPEKETAWQLLSGCEVVFICTPASTVPEIVEKAATYCSGLLTDVSSIKEPVMEKISLERFVGGHPMAGSERQGYAHSSETMLENAVYVLCTRPQSSLPIWQMQRLEDLIRQIGASPLHLDAREHDRAVAAVSHLPHVAAAALSLLAAKTDDGSLSRLAAGGFRDITRIASSDARLWSGISLESKRELLPILDHYIDLLNEFRQDLAADDQKALQRFFFQAAQYRSSLPVDGRGALSALSSLTVYITDKPGELGHVTTLLGENGININNIRIRELRTYEGGCLQLLLPDSAQAVRAAWLLKEAGYECD